MTSPQKGQRVFVDITGYDWMGVEGANFCSQNTEDGLWSMQCHD